MAAAQHRSRSQPAGGSARRQARSTASPRSVADAGGALAVGVLALVVGLGLPAGDPGAQPRPLHEDARSTFGETGGGIAHAIVGTSILVAIATAIALPVGMLIAIYVSEFARPAAWRAVIRLALDVLNGVPSIVIGIFVYALLVVGLRAERPGTARSRSRSSCCRSSRGRRWRCCASSRPPAGGELRARREQVADDPRVVLPTAFGGILTGATLAVARAAGETAPLLFTTLDLREPVTGDPSQALASHPVVIDLQYSEAPDQHLNDQAWAAAFVLITFVLVMSLIARILLVARERKLRAASPGQPRSSPNVTDSSAHAPRRVAAHSSRPHGANNQGRERIENERSVLPGATRDLVAARRSRAAGDCDRRSQSSIRPTSWSAPAARSSRRSSRSGRRPTRRSPESTSCTSRSAPAAASRRSRTHGRLRRV